MLWKEKSNVYFRLEQILLIKGLNLSVRVLRSIANIVEKRKDFRMHQRTFLENSTIIGCARKTIADFSEP